MPVPDACTASRFRVLSALVAIADSFPRENRSIAADVAESSDIRKRSRFSEAHRETQVARKVLSGPSLAAPAVTLGA